MSKTGNKNNRNPKAKEFKRSKDWKDKRMKRGSSEAEAESVSSEGSKVVDKRTPINDPSWHNLNPRLTEDAGSLAYAQISGTPVNIQTFWNGELQDNSLTFPGVMVFPFMPVPGVSKDAQSAVNTAMRLVYANIRKANSGSSNYDVPDLGMYLLAMDSLYTLGDFLKYLYGMTNLYSYKNRYVPRALVEACMVDYDDLIENRAQYRYELNYRMTQINKFAVPNVFNYYNRHKSLALGLYKDHSTSKSQFYKYVPSAVYKYIETDGPGHLQVVNVFDQETRITYRDIINLFDDLMNVLDASQDIAIMRGDIQKAYGDNLFISDQIAENFFVEPADVDEVKYQILNAAFWMEDSKTFGNENSRLNITQDPTIGRGNPIIFNPNFGSAKTNPYQLEYLNMKRILNSYDEVVTPLDNLMNTRMMQFTYIDESGSMRFSTLGSELYFRPWVCSYDKTGSFTKYPFVQNLSNDPENSTILTVHMLSLIKTMAFDWMPMVYLYKWLPNGTTKGELMGIGADVDNYTIVSDVEVGRLHDTSLMSLFGISG